MVCRLDPKFWVSGTYDAGPGKTCQWTAKMSTRTGPMTKGGRASMPNATPFESWSKRRLGRREAVIAIGRATRKAMSCEKMMSSMSMGNDCDKMLVVV